MTEPTGVPVPRPPGRLDREERAAWRAIAPKLVALGVYLPIDAVLLEQLVTTWVSHRTGVEMAQHARRAGDRRGWAEVRDSSRRLARELAAAFLVLREDRVRVGLVDEHGEDLDLRRLFTPGVPVQRVALTPDEARRLAAWNDRWLATRRDGA